MAQEGKMQNKVYPIPGKNLSWVQLDGSPHQVCTTTTIDWVSCPQLCIRSLDGRASLGAHSVCQSVLLEHMIYVRCVAEHIAVPLGAHFMCSCACAHSTISAHFMDPSFTTSQKVIAVKQCEV